MSDRFALKGAMLLRLWAERPYRATRDLRSGNRLVVFSVLPHTLGLPPAVWRVLSKCHETRNMAEYEGALDLDQGLVADRREAA